MAILTQADHIAAIREDGYHESYPADELPHIPAGFTYRYSFACPVWEAPQFDLAFCTDYPQIADREIPETGCRFAVWRAAAVAAAAGGKDVGAAAHDLIHTDVWGEVLACLIGERFTDRLRAYISPENWAEMLTRNTRYDDIVCASHDFCDANVFMADAFADIMGREPRGSWETNPDGSPVNEWEAAQATADSILWNAAWAYAKPRHLTAPAA